MTAQPVFEYRFADGKAVGAGGTFEGVVHGCTPIELPGVRIPQWGKLNDALRFDGPKHYIEIPAAHTVMPGSAFGVEMVIRARDRRNMTLVGADALPFTMFLRPADGGYTLGGSIHAGGKHAQTAGGSIAKDKWTRVGLCFTGDDLILLINGKSVARRTLRGRTVTATGKADMIAGTGLDGESFQFVGDLAGFRLWDEIPARWLNTVEKLEADGTGEIASKYADLGGARGFLKRPKGPERQVGAGRMRAYQGGNIYWSPATGAHEVRGPILNHYLFHKGPLGHLGFPMSDRTATPRSGFMNRFERGGIYWSKGTGAREVRGVIFVRYLDLGGPGDFLGYPRSDEKAVPGGRRSEFEGGVIYWSPGTGAKAVQGGILDRYRSLGGTRGFLGFPLTDEMSVQRRGGPMLGMRTITTGRLSRFVGGTIYWSKATGAFEVHGGIRAKYEELGGPNSELGYPASNETVGPAGVRYNNFQRGVIVWRAGIGARAITKLDLELGWVRSGKIDDGIGWFKKDKTAELITYTTVKRDGHFLEKRKRRPKGHDKTSHNINKTFTFANMQGGTKIHLKIDVDDWDKASGNDYLGTHERVFTIEDFWGLLHDGGVYNVIATRKGSDAPKKSTLTFEFSMSQHVEMDPTKNFREQEWWRSDNFNTAELTKVQYANTFRDVELVSNTWDAIMSPFDTLYYHLAYKSVAAKGNCFGMSLEAINSAAGCSVYGQPLYRWETNDQDSRANTANNVYGAFKELMNHMQGYQLGASAINWVIGRLMDLDAVRPLEVFENVKTWLARGDTPVLTMMCIADGRGHAVLPYKCIQGAGNTPHRILVADPNCVWREKAGDPTYIEIRKDNTFKFVGGSYESSRIVGGLLPGTLLIDIPYNRLNSQPRTPFWEVLQVMTGLLGMIMVFAGDGEVQQLRGDSRELYRTVARERLMAPNAIPGFARIPVFDAQGRIPELYAQRTPTSKTMAVEVRGKKAGTYSQLMGTAAATIGVEAPIAARAVDKLGFERLRHEKPMLEMRTTQGTKDAKVTYAVAPADRLKDRRGFSVAVTATKDAVARVGIAPRGQSLLLESAGSVKPIDLELRTDLGGAIKKAKFQVKPQSVSDAFRFTPNWEAIGAATVVERLSSFEGMVLDRELLRTR